MRTPLHRLVAVLAATTLLLAACGDDDDDGAAVGAGNGEATEVDSGEGASDETDPEDEDDVTTTEAETTTTTEAEPEVASGAECVVGTWQNDNEAWGEAFQAMIPADAPMELESVTGAVIIEFRADGTSTTTYDEWTISTRVIQPEGSGTITRNGVDHGTYEAGDDGSMSASDTEVNSVVDTSFTMGGQTMDMPGIEGEEAEVLGGAGTYECEGDRMRITVEGDGEVWMDRIG